MSVINRDNKQHSSQQNDAMHRDMFPFCTNLCNNIAVVCDKYLTVQLGDGTVEQQESYRLGVLSSWVGDWILVSKHLRTQFPLGRILASSEAWS